MKIKTNIYFFLKEHPLALYICYILVVSVFCIALAQLSHGSSFRIWVYQLFHDEIMEKGIEYGEVEKSQRYGNLLTKYRLVEFGDTSPERINPQAPMIALTFDDGPSTQATKRILDALERYHAKATFFVVGSNSKRYPELLQEIAASGNEIGNHTDEHKDLTTLSKADVQEQIENVDFLVQEATGAKTTVIRPPYGAYDKKLLKRLEAPVVLWDLDTEDWESRNAHFIVQKVMTQVKDGDIILLHDIYESTAEAVEWLLPMLREQGYQIVTVSEMAHYKGKDLEKHKAYGEIEGITGQ